MKTVAHLLDRIGAVGVAPADSVRPQALDEATFKRVLRRAVDQRITGLLLLAADRGIVALSDHQRGDLEAAHLTAMATALRLERQLLTTAGVLKAAGVPFRVLKGPAMAHLDYADPALRSYGDVDILTPGVRFDDAVVALIEAGGRRPYAELRPGFDRRFGKGAMIVQSDGSEVDLHRTFVAGPFGMTIDLEALFASERKFVVGGVTLPALDDTHRFLHACYHAAIGRGTPRIASLRDVAEMALSRELDVDAVVSTAVAWRAGAVLQRAISTTWNRLGLSHVTPLSVWAGRYVPDDIEARMLDGYTGPGWSFGAQALAAVRVIPGVRAKLAYAHALVLPQPSALASRDASRLGRWRRAARLTARRMHTR